MADSDGAGEDRALLARVANQDRVALELLYRRHAPWITARLQARCGNTELVDTAVQDTFLAIWRSAMRYRQDGEVAAWMWGIAIRRLIDLLRKRRAVPVDTDAMAPAATPSDEIEEAALGSGQFGDAGDALRTLSPDLQAVIVATAIDGLTTREAARLLGVPQGTVKTRLMRARRELQEALT